MTRRDLLCRCHSLAATGWLLHMATESRAASVADTTWHLDVCEMVIRRESLSDGISPFRRGGADRIIEAMDQFGRVCDELAVSPPARLRALEWALRQYVDSARREAYSRDQRSSHLDGSVTSFGEGDPKCNKFAADAYAHGAGEGLSAGSTWGGAGDGSGWPARKIDRSLWPPQANHLAKAGLNLRSLTDARSLRQDGQDKAAPQLGDLISFPSEDDLGHVGLYLGRNLIVSAKASGIEIGTVEVETESHGGIAMIRKYTGTGR